MPGIGLTTIKPLHPRRIIPRGAKAHGITEDGKQIYKLVTPRSKSEPLLDYEGNQEIKAIEALDLPAAEKERQIAVVKKERQIWEKNPLTGVPLYPRRQPVHYELEEIFIMESDGQGNDLKVLYEPLTPEQIAAEKRDVAMKSAVGDLAGALVDSGMTAQEFVAGRIEPTAKQVLEAEVEELPVLEKTVREYPREFEPGIYLLSDKTRFEGEEDEAVVAEVDAAARVAAKLAEEEAFLDSIPEPGAQPEGEEI